VKNALIVLSIAFAGVSATSVAAQAKGKTTALDELQRQYSTALSKYFEPYSKAKTDEERSKIQLDAAMNPAKTYLPKFKKLAMAESGSPQGFDAWMMVLETAESARDHASETMAVDKAIAGYLNSPQIARLVAMIPYTLSDQPSNVRQAKIHRWLAEIQESRNPEVRASALFSQASSAAEDGRGDPVAARKAYAKVIAEYPSTSYAKRAQSAIFEMDHLSIGQVAPDFNAVDPDGTAFKLSDYRGKVVVLDFWGFW
jgi:hypothetical protein